MAKSFKDVLNAAGGDTAINILPVEVVQGVDNIATACERASLEEAERIWPVLEASLDLSKGFGLAAIQIGIPKKVAIIVYNGQKYRLLNTEIVAKNTEVVIYNEGCLSIKGKTINTSRYAEITIIDDILGRKELSGYKDGLLPIIFQHEIDHFEGKTIFDHKLIPVRKEVKIGRNAPCPCGSGQKYKKCCIGK